MTIARARRLIVVSDLHLGGDEPAMMSQPARLARFIERLPAEAADDEQLELVIAGDFVDFLAIPPFAAWTSEVDAARKLEATMRDGPFACVFDALGRHLEKRHLLTVLLGNHDIELAMPRVQSAFLSRIGATPHQLHFIDNNRAYRVGALLVEHGNRYDGANENDWTALRAIASALSRNEDARDELEPSAGSRVVEKLISPLKAAGYPFVDLLQPQGELVVLLLVAFEPALLLDLPKLARILKAKRLQDKNTRGLQPGETRHVAFQPGAPPDDELRRAFKGAYDVIRSADEQVGFGDLVMTAWRARNDSLSSILARGDDVPAERLQQIRVAMRKMLLGDRSNEVDGDTEQYGKAARRLIDRSKGEIETVVMGHTHLARHIGPPDRATYINTGTWADVIRVPGEALEDDHDRELQDFLRGLRGGGYRSCPATFADVRVEASGAIAHARMRTEQPP